MVKRFLITAKLMVEAEDYDSLIKMMRVEHPELEIQSVKEVKEFCVN